MLERQPEIMVREAVGVFDSEEQLQAAIDDLEMSDFSRQDITVLSDLNRSGLRNGKSGIYQVDGAPAHRETHVTPEEYSLIDGALIAGGILAGILASTPFWDTFNTQYSTIFVTCIGAGIGLFVGTLVAHSYHNSRARDRSQKLRKTGLPLWVRTRNYSSEQKAYYILRKNGGHDVQVQDVPIAIPEDTIFDMETPAIPAMERRH